VGKRSGGVEDMEGLKILITGGNGFVGSNLARFFLSQGHEVAITVHNEDNNWRIRSIARDINLIKADLTDSERVSDIFMSFKPQVVIHSATYGGYHFETDVQRIFETNIKSTINLVENFIRSNSELLINTGSSSEYGFKLKPMSEDNLLEPVGSYSVSKAASTLYCRSRAVETRRNILTYRLFSVYGYYEAPHRLIPYLLLSLINDTKALLNNPSSVRDFIFIQDVCTAFQSSILHMDKLGNAEIFNLGTGIESKIVDVVKVAEDISGKMTNIIWKYGQERIGDKATHWVADMSYTESILNWKPEFSLEKGLRATYDWIAENVLKYNLKEG
jgi:nucleoside-diphosphate-sugar epimerase